MKGSGISNRETPQQEDQERQENPPIDNAPPAPSDEEINQTRDGQTSHKAGSRSDAQKEAESRYPDRSMPATHKVDGAFGKESSRHGT
jgi:hypothetical protein